LQVAQSLKEQWKVLVVGFILGILASVIASYICAVLNPTQPSTPPTLTAQRG
jgi:hypothetical protein